MTIFVRIPDTPEGILKARCTKCGAVFVTRDGDEHLALLLLEHAASHDRK